MKYLYILLIVLTASLVACKDADDQVTRFGTKVTLYEGTRFILYSSVFQTLDTIVVENTRVLNGTTSIQKNPSYVGQSINGLDYKFNTFNSFNNMYFNFEDEKLVWIGSSSINSSFVFEEMTITETDKKNFEYNFIGDKPISGFGDSDNTYYILIEGKIGFSEK